MRLVRKGIRIASLCLHIEGKSEGKKDGVPVNLLLLKSDSSNSPIGPIQPEWDLGYTKTSQNIQKASHAIVLVRKGIRIASLFLHI
jgi:hypothetical protein